MADSREPSTPPSTAQKRWKRIWTVVSFLLVLTALAIDQRDHFRWLQGADRNVSDAIGTISIGAIYEDYAERFNMCTYHWLVFCEVKQPVPYSLPQLPAEASSSSSGGLSFIGAALVAIPRAPDATIYALHKRWVDIPIHGATPFVMTIVFVVLCAVGILAYLQDRENIIGVLFVPLFILIGLWVLKWILIGFANGVWLVLEALIILGGLPALVAAAISAFQGSREVGESAVKVAESFKK
jgi:hypothetical protein